MRERLDRVMVDRGLAESRERAQALIMAGAVAVDGQPARRVAMPIGDDAQIDLRERLPYVSRGGVKLAHALDHFAIAVDGRVRPGGWVVALVKPQFEAGREQVGKGGVVRDPAVHEQVVARVGEAIERAGWRVVGVTPSPITGPAGNREFLAYACSSS